MRYRPLIVMVVIALSVAACGGGGGKGAGTTDIFDTGTFGVGPVETATTPPAATTEQPQPAIQIQVPKGLPIGPQSPAEQVAQVQKALTALGFKIGKPDGIYGGKTRKAVVKFQKNHKLDADGLVGAKTAKAINKALAEQTGAG